MGGSRPREVAGGSAVASGLLLVVVDVESPAKLLLRVAHAVRAVVTGCGVGCDAIADAIGKTTHDAKEVTDAGCVYVIGYTGESAKHALAEFFVGGRREIGGCTPIAIDCRASRSCSVCWVVAGRVGARGVDRSNLGGESIEIVKGADAAAIHGDKTIIIGLLEIHVDDTARPDGVHLRPKEGPNVGELSGLDRVAAIFGEEDRDVVRGKFLGTDIIARFRVTGVSAPE